MNMSFEKPHVLFFFLFCGCALLAHCRQQCEFIANVYREAKWGISLHNRLLVTEEVTGNPMAQLSM